MRILFVLNWWESFVSVGQGLLSEVLTAAVAGGLAGLLRLRRKRSRRVDRAIAARIPDRQVLEGIPLRMKAAIHRRVGPATADAIRMIQARDRAGTEAAALRAEKAVNNTIAWMLAMYHDAGWLGRLRVAIGLPFLFKACLAYQVALLDRRAAPELADLLLVR